MTKKYIMQIIHNYTQCIIKKYIVHKVTEVDPQQQYANYAYYTYYTTTLYN